MLAELHVGVIEVLESHVGMYNGGVSSVTC